MQSISVPTNNPEPPVNQSALTSDVLTVGALVFGVGGFFVKFLAAGLTLVQEFWRI